MRGVHILGTTSNFRGKDLVEFFTLFKGPGGEDSAICPTVIETLGKDHVDRTGEAFS